MRNIRQNLLLAFACGNTTSCPGRGRRPYSADWDAHQPHLGEARP